MFIGADTPEKLKQQVDKIRALALSHGRDEPEAIKHLCWHYRSDGRKRINSHKKKLAEYSRYASPESRFGAFFKFSRNWSSPNLQMMKRYLIKQTNSIASVNNKFKEQKVTRDDLKAQHVLGGRYPLDCREWKKL